MALDTSILIELQKFGSALIDGDSIEDPTISRSQRNQLHSLAALLDLWLVRDIRMVPLMRGLTDFRKTPESSRLRRREYSLQQVASSLAFQLGFEDWDWRLATKGHVEPGIRHQSIPGDADRELVSAAQTLGVDVFLTLDKRLLRGNEYGDVLVNIWSPSELTVRLERWSVSHFGGGNLEHEGCLYEHPPLMGDIGKWSALIEMFDES